MFNNLIESSSHVKEFKRRGSFVLFTTISYAVLLVVMGVVSVYAYDARLEQQSLEIVTLINPQELVPEVQSHPAAQPDRPRPSDNRNDSRVPERATAMLSVNHPEVVPENVSTAPNKNLSLPESGRVLITGRDYDPEGGGGPGVKTGGGGNQVVVSQPNVSIEEPPPAPDPPKPPKVLHKGVITSQALTLPKPNYPPLAKQMNIQGMVSVQVLIDESGKVISAKAVGGSPFLTAEAQKAAMQARFSPTILNDQPVKVSGVITYNFLLNR